MKLSIPNELKSTVPPTKWGKILAATPVVMAVVATALAGLASSEMTKAQYERSMAAQLQSKAGDQWNFFQAKRLRAATQRNTLDLLAGTVDVGPLNAAMLRQSATQLPGQIELADAQIKEAMGRVAPPATVAATAPAAVQAMQKYLAAAQQHKADADRVKVDILTALEGPDAPAALAAMAMGELADIGAEPAVDPTLKAAMDAIDSSKPESQVSPLVAQVKGKTIEEALRAAKDRAAAFDVAMSPTNQAIGRIETLLSRQTTLLQEPRAILLAGGVAPSVTPAPNREFLAARLRFAAARYDTEARLNQSIGRLYEVQVRKSNLAAERHHLRSQRFFFGMLAAQMGVIVATFAMAAQKRSFLWGFAAAAGLVAVAFGAYVYLFI